MDLLVGSVFVGGALASLAAAGTYAAVRSSGLDRHFAELVRRAADRYAGASITAWEFARGKLRGDPIYRATLSADVLTSGGTLLDVGCGQGLTLALLAEARRAVDAGTWPPGSPPPPRFERMAGIETRPQGRGDRARGARGRRRDHRRRRPDAVDGAGERRAAVRRAAPDASRGAGRAADRDGGAAGTGRRRARQGSGRVSRMALYRRASRQSAESDRVQDAAISRFTRGPRRNGASVSRDADSRPTCSPMGARDAVRQRAVPPDEG